MKPYILYIVVSLSISFLLVFTLISPKYQSLVSLNEEISEKKFEIQSQEKYFQDLQETSEKLEEYESSLLKIDSALPQGPSLPDLLNFLQQASSQAGLSFKGVSPVLTASTEEIKIKETRINLALVGQYSAFKNFLSILEKSARLIEIENISFSSPEEGPFDFNLTIKVHSY